MKKYSRTLDHLILAALAAKSGDFDEAAQHMQVATEDENFDEEMEMLSEENEKAIEEDASLELAEDEDEEETSDEEVSDEESLAAAMARVATSRKTRGRRSVSVASEDEEEMSEEEMSEEEVEDDEETAKAKKRLERQQANLKRFKKK